MIIDNFYNDIDKSSFYLGMVSQVYRENSVVQVENLSWLSHRKLKSEMLIPNTINYFVVVDTVQGLFIGEIFQSKISNSDSVHNSMNDDRKEDIYPEISIDIIGVMSQGEKFFELAGFRTVGIGDKVYIANKEIIDAYLDSIDIYREEDEYAFPPFAKLSILGNEPVRLKPQTLFNRHIMTVGTTNSGKSTTSLSILDKLLESKKKILIIDPTGEYSDSFTALNDDCSKGEVQKLKLGVDTILSVGEVSNQQWAMIFETNDSTQPAVLANAIKSLRYQKKNSKSGIYTKSGKSVIKVNQDMASVTMNDKDFNLIDLPGQIAAETNSINSNGSKYISNSFNFNSNQWLVQKVQYKLDNTSLKCFFSDDSSKTDLISALDKFLAIENHSLYIDASEIGTTDGVGGMIVDLVSNYIINKDKNEIKPFVLFVDEIHRYTKSTTLENDYYTGLTAVAREGRKKGIFLFLTTQNPQDVSDVLLGQIGTLIVHRLTHYEELRSIQNHLKSNTLGQIKKLNRGEAILTSINLLQDIHLKIDKSNRNHANDTPLL